MISVVAIAVMGFLDVCVAYSIGVGGDAVGTKCMTCIPDASPLTSSSVHSAPSANRSLSSVASATSKPGVFPGHPAPEEVSYMPPAPSTHSPQPSSQLNPSAKAGIIATSIMVFFISLLLILEYTYHRRKGQDRSLKRAIDEVERGTEPKDSTASDSKENMVLESRVEIVIEGEEQDSLRDSCEDEGQWDAGTEGEDSDGDLGEWGRGRRWERGRNRRSLPRTES